MFATDIRRLRAPVTSGLRNGPEVSLQEGCRFSRRRYPALRPATPLHVIPPDTNFLGTPLVSVGHILFIYFPNKRAKISQNNTLPLSQRVEKMAEEPPTTPASPIRAPDDDQGAHTRPPDPLTGQNLQRAKRHKTITVTAPPPATGLRRGTATKDNTAANMLAGQFEDLVRSASIQKEVAVAMGSCLDSFVASWKGVAKEEHRRVARSMVNDALQHLSANIFAASNGQLVAPMRAQSTQPTSARQPTSTVSSSQKSISWGPPSYADVARSAAPSGASKITAHTVSSSIASAAERAIKEDLRVLIALDVDRSEGAEGLQTHYGPRAQPFQVRTMLCQGLGLRLADIPEVTHTKTGYAIRPASKTVRDKIIAGKEEVIRACGAQEVSLPAKWHTYAVPDVPFSFTGLNGGLVNADDLLAEEAEAQTGHKPVRFWRSRHGPDVHTGRGTFLVAFLTPVRSFRLFNTSGYARPVEKKPRATLHNPGCQGYCNGNNCKRAPRCNNCGERTDLHEAGQCTKAQCCANCHGPFQAGHNNCPAEPKRVKGVLVWPSKRRLQKIRRAGIKRYKEANTQAPSDAMETDTAEPLEAHEGSATQPTRQGQAGRGAARKRGPSLSTAGSAPHHTPSETSSSSNSGASLPTEHEEEALPEITVLSSRPRRNKERPDYNLVRTADKAFGERSTTPMDTHLE
ncbi:hypothetical protein FJTKL_12084 [Diaporthe vaccinii]|uniref:Uncharacterized protein n=1 Tax=Diaporthe vaccinii TaxID=105482 RepID=A0ABR4EF56_9PEZI